MTRLNTVNPAQAEGKAKALLDTVKAKMGQVPNLMKVMANSPAVLEGYLGFSGPLAGGTLPAKLRELLALTLSQENGCDYCLAAHSLIGKHVGLTEEQVIAARRGAAEDPKAAAALGFARTVAARHGKISDADLAAVRDAGFTDGEVAEIVAHVALNVLTNYLNNVADTDIDFPKVQPLADAHEGCSVGGTCSVTR